MFSPAISSSALLLSLSSPQVPPQPIHELTESVQGIVRALEPGHASVSGKETLTPRLERLERSLGQFDLKLRAFSGSSGNVRHWIGSYTEGKTKLTALFEERSDGKGYSGFDLRLDRVRINFGDGENRQRMNIMLYDRSGSSYVGVASQNTKDHQQAVYGGMRLNRELSVDAGVVSTGDSRVRLLHNNGKEQLSAGFGKDASGNAIGSASWNNKRAWFLAQGGESIPTSFRLTFGDIDQTRSQRAFAFTDGGLNEPFPNAPTYRFSMGDNPTFHLLRRIPGQFLGMHPGDTGLDVLYTNNTSFDVSAGIRLKNQGNLKSPFIGARYQRDLKLNGDRFGLEVGSSLGDINTEVRARVEYSNLTKKTGFGIMISTKLK